MMPLRHVHQGLRGKPGGRPFLLTAGARIAGFALVRDAMEEPAPPPHSVAEFFVLRRYRRRGIGTEAAGQIIRSLPGRWVVRQAPANLPARAFWRRVARELTAGAFRERQDDRYHTLEFEID